MAILTLLGQNCPELKKSSFIIQKMLIEHYEEYIK